MSAGDEVLSAEEREWIADEERWVGSTTASRIVRRLAAELAAEREKNQSTYCAYCGDYTVRLDDPQSAEKVEQHIKTCAKHPMRRTEADLAAARREVATARATGAHEACDELEPWTDDRLGTSKALARVRARYPRPAEPPAPGPGGAP